MTEKRPDGFLTASKSGRWEYHCTDCHARLEGPSGPRTRLLGKNYGYTITEAREAGLEHQRTQHSDR